MDNAIKQYRRWRRVVLDTPIIINNTTGAYTYNFSRPIRNMTFTYAITGRFVRNGGTSTGNGTTCEIGFGVSGGSGEGYNIFNSNWEETIWENGGSWTNTNIRTVTDGQSFSSITTNPWCSAYGNGKIFNESITSSTIRITAYEEYR